MLFSRRVYTGDHGKYSQVPSRRCWAATAILASRCDACLAVADPRLLQEWLAPHASDHVVSRSWFSVRAVVKQLLCTDSAGFLQIFKLLLPGLMHLCTRNCTGHKYCVLFALDEGSRFNQRLLACSIGLSSSLQAPG